MTKLGAILVGLLGLLSFYLAMNFLTINSFGVK